jgi:hypothetical protein
LGTPSGNYGLIFVDPGDDSVITILNLGEKQEKNVAEFNHVCYKH